MTTPDAGPPPSDAERRARTATTLAAVSVSDAAVGVVLLLVGLSQDNTVLTVVGAAVLVMGLAVLGVSRVLRRTPGRG